MLGLGLGSGGGWAISGFGDLVLNSGGFGFGCWQS